MIKGADQYLNEKPFGKFLGLFSPLLAFLPECNICRVSIVQGQ